MRVGWTFWEKRGLLMFGWWLLGVIGWMWEMGWMDGGWHCKGGRSSRYLSGLVFLELEVMLNVPSLIMSQADQFVPCGKPEGSPASRGQHGHVDP